MPTEVKVPNLGEFEQVEIVEIRVKPGDVIAANDPLITLETDKATMDVPSPLAGRVLEMRVRLKDQVSEGDLILMLEGTDLPAGSPKPVQKPAPVPAPAAVQARSAPAGAVDVVVLGSGPGGYTAAFRAADLGLNTVLVERYPVIGGVCLNVGCIPSKALLHAAKVISEAHEMKEAGIEFGAPKIDHGKLAKWKSGVVAKLTGGLAGMAKQRKVRIVQGTGKFSSPNELVVDGEKGTEIIPFKHCIIAAGSQSARLPFLPEDPRIIDSTGAVGSPGTELEFAL